MHVNVKPLTYWLIHNKYTVRFRHRSPSNVQGVVTTPEGQMDFDYDPDALTVRLPDRVVTINQFGWETEPDTNEVDGTTTVSDNSNDN